MDQGPDELRTEIEQTRRRLGGDVDALTEKVHPGRVVQRRATAARGGLGKVKERVMGTSSGSAHSAGGGVGGAAHSAGGAVSGAADSVSGTATSAAQGVSSAVTSAPGMARQQAQGNPLAAGVIAFGVGWLVSSILPASEKEQQAAQQLTETAKSNLEPVKQVAGQAAGELKESLREPAQQAAESVKSSATGQVKDDAQNAAQDVRGSSGGGSSGGQGGTSGTTAPPVGGGTAW